MIVCVSPSSLHYDETHNTLKYGNRAKEIKTKVSRNTLNFDRHVSQYVKLIYELRQEIAELKEKSKSSTSDAEEGFKKRLERDRKLTEEAISQVRAGQERARVNIEEMGNLRALITCVENAKKIVEGWVKRYNGTIGDMAIGQMNLPSLFKNEAERKKTDADELMKCLSERHRNFIQRLMFLRGGEGNIFEQSCKNALKMLTNNGVDDFHIEYVKTEIRSCKATMERDAAIRQGLNMEEDMLHSANGLTGWINASFDSLNEFAQTAEWGPGDEDTILPSLQTIWDFTSKLYRFKAAKCLGQTESPSKPFLSAASIALTPSRKARFLAQLEASPAVQSPRRTPRKFKVGTSRRLSTQPKRKSPRKDKKKSVRWTVEPPETFQLPQELTPLPSPVYNQPEGNETLEEDSFFMPPQETDAARPILPLPLRKAKSTNFSGILRNPGISSMQQFVTEDESFLSASSTDQNSPLTEIAIPGQSVLRSRPSRAELNENGTLRGTKRRSNAVSPGRAKRVFSGSSVGNKENGGPSMGVRRASDSPVKTSFGGGARRLTLGGTAGRVTNPGWGSMGPPPLPPPVKAPSTEKTTAGKRGWR
jgi:hypothetical protein